MTVCFWTCVAITAYVYVGYPAMLRVWARLWPRPYAADSRLEPDITIVLAARNEGARLGARIDNLLALDYPADRRQIIVVCDGCTDDTQQVVARYAGVVEAVTLRPSGKALSLNAGMARARGSIAVFADARQVFASDALRELVAPFADPEIGAVTGELLLDCESALFSNRRSAGRSAPRTCGRGQRRGDRAPRASRSPADDALDDCRRRRHVLAL